MGVHYVCVTQCLSDFVEFYTKFTCLSYSLLVTITRTPFKFNTFVSCFSSLNCTVIFLICRQFSIFIVKFRCVFLCSLKTRYVPRNNFRGRVGGILFSSHISPLFHFLLILFDLFNVNFLLVSSRIVTTLCQFSLLFVPFTNHL